MSEDEYTSPTIYGAGPHTITREQTGTRYVLAGVRTFVDPADPKDLQEAHRLQDALTIEQKTSGQFDIPNWDPVSQEKGA